jgi:hypothetical protein
MSRCANAPLIKLNWSGGTQHQYWRVCVCFLIAQTRLGTITPRHGTIATKICARRKRIACPRATVDCLGKRGLGHQGLLKIWDVGPSPECVMALLGEPSK